MHHHTPKKRELIEFLTKFEKILNLYNQFKIFKKKKFNVKNRIFSPISLKSDKERLIDFLNKNEIIFNIKDNLLDFTKKNLTTEILAKNIIAKIK